MNNIINFFSNILGFIINIIYNVCHNYGITIFIFTVVSKIILFPVNIFIQKNSIKMVKMKPQIEELKIKYKDDKEAFMEAQIDLFEKEKYHPSLGTIPLLIQIPIILGLIKVIKLPSDYIENITNMYFLKWDLSIVPTFSQYCIIPILAGIATVLLCLFQNKLNVLQKEENIYSKIATTILTVGLTMYFVFLVPVGVGLYWIFGDILAILQLYILNWIFPPEKYVDYEALEKVKKYKREQAEKEKIIKKKSKYYYKKFFDEENINNMKLVFYSEQSGFYKYFKGMIEYILENSDIIIHYVTSDINDKIFEMNNPKLIPYFVDTNHLIPLFMKLEADIVVMTTPDLQNLYLKRSIVKKDIEYIYTDHAITSSNLMYRTGALDFYDTIFSTGENQTLEIREIEKLRNTKEKNIINVGYCLLDNMFKEYNEIKCEAEKTILIAPSWQKDNIMDLCIEDILDNILKKEYKVILRPHPQYVRLYQNRISEIFEKYKEFTNFEIQKDFSTNDTVYNANLLITDWSCISFEYSFSTLKPTLFIDTPMKVMNEDYKKINVKPIHLELRNIIGKSLKLPDINEIGKLIDEMINSKSKYEENILQARNKYIYNFGKSSEIASKYIIERLKERGKNG